LLLAGLTGSATAVTRTMAAEYRVSSAEAIGRLAGSLQPGDVIILADGTWKDQAIVFGGRGTAERPVTLRAETPGKVVLTGRSTVAIDGEHLIVSGLSLRDGTATGDGVKLAGRHCRLTDT
jgi:poly(beta-D-mannuronate) lyase